MRRMGADDWAGMLMLGLCLALVVPFAVGIVPTRIPLLAWMGVYAVAIAGLVVATWREPPRVRERVALGVAAVAVWAVALTAPIGFLSIIVVFLVSIAAHIVSLGVVVGLIAANTAVLVASGFIGTMPVSDAIITAGYIVLLQLLSALSCIAGLREREARLALALAHVELRAAGALLGESARTAERLRISRDLHDSMGHRLAVLTLELEAARHQPDAGRSRAHVERAGRVARELLGDVRATVSELRTAPADLRRALEAVVAGVPGIEIELRVAGDLAVGDDERVALVRATQEIVTNTVRHAGASRLRIDVRRDAGGDTVVEAIDDGRGADRPVPGNGLRGIAERVEALGGSVEFDGAEGFRVTARVPAA